MKETAFALGTIQPRTTCTHPGCERPLHASGLCRLHYTRKREGRDLDEPLYGYTPWGQVVDRALALADSHGTDRWGKELDQFRTAIKRIVACGFEEIKPGWRKKRIVLRIVRTRGRCTVEGCHSVHRAKGMCDRHYRQKLRADRQAAKGRAA